MLTTIKKTTKNRTSSVPFIRILFIQIGFIVAICIILAINMNRVISINSQNEADTLNYVVCRDNADKALYKVKESQKNNIMFYGDDSFAN